jgi:Cof subfamily protein (haloacid dehalogenase superfamily)
MLALDLDGTLVTEDNAVSERTRAGLLELDQQGVEIVISTGRRYRTAARAIDNLGLPVHAVCNGGALVKRPDATTLHSQCFPSRDFRQLVKTARSYGLALFAQRDSHILGGADFVMDAGIPWNAAAEWYFRENQSWSSIDEQFHESDANDFLVLGSYGDKETLLEFARDVQGLYRGDYSTLVVPHHQSKAHYCEVAQASVSKWTGLVALSEALGIDSGCICAVGDELNDLPMIENAAVGVAMANANPDLLAAADWVCGHHLRDGLVDVIDFIQDHNSRKPGPGK